jgi:hypothetical protein
MFSFIFLFTIGLARVVFALTYYVSPTGTDSNPGTQVQPWRTIKKAANSMNGGDTCIVQDGTYSDALTISRSGSSGNVITFQSQNKWGAIISNPQFSGAPILWHASTSYAVNDIRYPITLPDGYSGRYYTQTVSSCTSGSSEPTWPTTLHNTVSDGTCTWRHDGVLTNTVTIYGNYVKFDGFKFLSTTYYNGGGSGDPNTALVVNGANCTITNCYFTRNTHINLLSRGDSNTITNNYFTDTEIGIVVAGTGYLVQNNEMYGLKQISPHEDCDYMRFWGTNGIIRGNKLWGYVSANQGDSHTDCFQSFDASDGLSGWITNILIENNYCHSLQGGNVTDEHSQAGNGLIVRNNVFKVTGYEVMNPWCVNNFQFYNNTVILDRTHAYGHYPYCVTDAHPPLKPDRCNVTCTIKNNIFYQGCSQSMCGTTTGITYDCDYNLMYRDDYTFSKVGSHDVVNVDPLFVSVPLDDYQLRVGSPAINAGATLTGFSTDKNGATRPQGSAWDIGAYEYNDPLNPAPNQPKNLRKVTP